MKFLHFCAFRSIRQVTECELTVQEVYDIYVTVKTRNRRSVDPGQYKIGRAHV